MVLLSRELAQAQSTRRVRRCLKVLSTAVFAAMFCAIWLLFPAMQRGTDASVTALLVGVAVLRSLDIIIRSEITKLAEG